MTDPNAEKLVVAISSRALFDLSESHDLFEREGLEAYRGYQMARKTSRSRRVSRSRSCRSCCD